MRHNLQLKSSKPAAPAEAQVPGGAPPRTLLYVEDNPANLKLVEQLIARRPDMRLLTAVNGPLGIEVARASQPEVILMDINLPGISGIRSPENPARRPRHGAHPRRGPQRQCHAARHREGPGGGILPLSHQTHQGQGVHGHAERGAGICRPRGWRSASASRALAVISSSDILNAKILIVDDQEANVRLLERMLRGAGYVSVASTMDPREVCELHRQNRYDLILLDLQMPGMDGFQVMEGLKEIETEGYLPVLVITAQPGHKLRALQAGAKDFVSKPLDLAEVRARAYNMLEVRLLHMKTKNYSQLLEQTVRELESSREVIRLKNLEERKKLDQELAWAEETQKSLLPHCLPQFENFRVCAFNNPTRYVGGDFYEFLQLSSGDWVGVLADVSGKGISAALLSSMLLGALCTEFRYGTEPRGVLNRVNQLLYKKTLPGRFVTLFLFLLGPQGVGQFISAGHNPAHLFRSATGKIEELTSGDMILGAFASVSYQSSRLHLHQGDILVVYSDGLTEARNQQKEMFGEERLLKIIQQEAPSGSHALQQKLLRAIEEFTHATPQLDDISFLIVEKYQ